MTDGIQDRLLTRRNGLRIGATAIAGGALAAISTSERRQVVAAAAQDASPVPIVNVTTDGVGGGGIVPNGAGQAQFALTAFAVPGADGAEPTFFGSFTLKDETDPVNLVDMQSSFFNQITAYSVAEPNARQIIGWATVNGGGPYPFLLQVEDVGPVGSGEDTFNLVFGNDALPFLDTDAKHCDCGGFTYALRGNVTSGDIVIFPLGPS